MSFALWDDPLTADLYETFCLRHARYGEANERLAASSDLRPGLRVLDFGAGTGRTAEAVLPWIGDRGEILCVEPARAMRERGQARMRDGRVRWVDRLPEKPGDFDRVVSGAALWQMTPLADAVAELAALLREGGALCFTIPSLYLGEPDEPGGGSDPWLVTLPARLAVGQPSHGFDGAVELLSDVRLRETLEDAGLAPERFDFRHRWTQDAYRDWLKIPVLTERLLAAVPRGDRARRIDEACEGLDLSAWRWERWSVWRAWKQRA